MGGVAVVTEAADTRALAGDALVVSAAASVPVELLVATVEPGLVGPAAAMARATTHPGSQRDATAPTAAPDKGLMHREVRLERRFIVLLRVRKAGLLPGSLLSRQVVPVATMSREINPELGLLVSPACSPVVTRGQVGIFASNALERLPKVQRRPTGLGRDRMQPAGSDSTRKQRKDYATGKAKRLDTATQNVITRNTGKIASTMTMIGGVIIATLSFLLVEDFGAGMTAGGIQPGATTHIIRTTIMTARSMAMMDFDPMR